LIAPQTITIPSRIIGFYANLQTNSSELNAIEVSFNCLAFDENDFQVFNYEIEIILASRALILVSRPKNAHKWTASAIKSLNAK